MQQVHISVKRYQIYSLAVVAAEMAVPVAALFLRLLGLEIYQFIFQNLKNPLCNMLVSQTILGAERASTLGRKV